MMAKRLLWCCLLWAASVEAQGEQSICYGPGSMAASVILTFLVALLLLLAAWYWWKKYKSKSEQLILETDAEKGKGEYAFDNPGFKDSSLLQVSKNPAENQKQEGVKSKWNQWSPLSALTTKSEKKKTQDDTAVDEYEVKVIALRSHDFTGLGFNICGNMKEGIFVKDILHRGPAFESGKLNPGDRIHSVTISFEHMVYEDALTILSYASPYEVMIEAKSGRLQYNTPGQGGRPSHPVYRSSSCIDLYHKPSKKRLFAEDSSQGGGSSNYSSLQKSKSNMTTLERKESKSPKVTKPKPHHPEHQKTENKYQKFGVRVLPSEQQRKSPKAAEQNDNNVNIEKQHADVVLSIDEVDEARKVVQPPPKAKKREKKPPSPTFERDGSGIRRDENGIPQEIPHHMLNAAVAARNNRKSVQDVAVEDEEVPKRKGKAPSPPEEDSSSSPPHPDKSYNSDSDAENDSSVNTIELNSSDITVHQTEEVKEEQNRQDRKTVSTGDLTRIKKTIKTTGTLERAQSLDISDPTPKKRDEDDVFVALDKEPRLSLILDGLNTFQRNRLKKSTEWGNLEDAILKLNQDDDSIVSVEDKSSLDRISLTEKTPEFDALVNKINEIKRESMDKTEVVENEIWPSMEVTPKEEKPPMTQMVEPPPEHEQGPPAYERRQQMVTTTTTTSPAQTLHVYNNINEPFGDVTVDRTNFRQRLPEDLPTIPPPPGSDKPEITTGLTEEWTISEDIVDTSPPASLEETSPSAEHQVIKPEEVLSKIPLLSSMVRSQQEEAASKKAPLIADNSTDETKTNSRPNLQDVTEIFLFTEQMNCSQDAKYPRSYDMNVSDDMKVSRHSLGTNSEPKSDDDKSERHVSNVNVTNGDSELHSLELSINEEPNEFYTTALDTSIKDTSRVTISTPDLIKNVTLAEALSTLNDDYSGDKFSVMSNSESSPEDNSTLTYITEIKVTPNNGTRTTTTVTRTNVSEVEVNGRSLEKDFENYVKNFETKLEQFENNIQSFDKDVDEFIGADEGKNKEEEEEVHKIQEIAEEQLKKLPEMRFTTSTYSGVAPEKRQSQIELLRSNFEKAPARPPKPESKSRIPIATTAKTPPTSPERRDSRSLDLEHDRAILELMSSSSKVRSPAKNVTVTSIRNNSKIPSGLPVLRPPVAPRRAEHQQDGNVSNVHVNANGSESSFKQWVFNPANVTNVSVVAETKEK